jgi:hypothetical protein
VNGSSVSDTITFTASPPLVIPPSEFLVAFTESGLPASVAWGVTVDGITQSSLGGLVTFTGPNGTYGYSIEDVPGYGATPTNGTVVVTGADVNVPVEFVEQKIPGPIPNATTSPSNGLFGLPGLEGWGVLGTLLAVAVAAATIVGYVLGGRSRSTGP